MLPQSWGGNFGVRIFPMANSIQTVSLRFFPDVLRNNRYDDCDSFVRGVHWGRDNYLDISTSSNRIRHGTTRLLGDPTGCCSSCSWFNFVCCVAEMGTIENLGIIRVIFLCRKSCIKSLRLEL